MTCPEVKDITHNQYGPMRTTRQSGPKATPKWLIPQPKGAKGERMSVRDVTYTLMALGQVAGCRGGRFDATQIMAEAVDKIISLDAEVARLTSALSSSRSDAIEEAARVVEKRGREVRGAIDSVITAAAVRSLAVVWPDKFDMLEEKKSMSQQEFNAQYLGSFSSTDQGEGERDEV